MRRVGGSRLLRGGLLLGTALCALTLVPGAPRAQLAALVGGGRGNAQPVSRDAPVTFQADHVEYDRDSGIVTATGHVEAWQNDHVLRADTVTFDRNTNVAAASGNVALVEPDGQTLFSDYAELTEGMRDGVLRGMRAILAQNGKLAANGARRTEGKLNELSRAVYSTCNLCQNDPSRPPEWQLRARTLLQDTENKRIEYQDVFLDVFGLPVAYLPFFSHPDPSVKRQSGFLVPSIGNTSHLGAFVAAPYYWVLDDQSDATLTPTLTTSGDENLNTSYRRRFNDGTLSVDLSAGYERSTDRSSSVGPTRGGVEASLFAKGQFNYDDEWRYGFDIERASSRDYMRDFNLSGQNDVLTSQVYLEGFGVNAYSRLDLRAYEGLTTSTDETKLPYVLPRYQYSFLGEPDALGGRLSLDAGAYNVYRESGTKDQRASLTAEYSRPFTGALGDQYSVVLHLDAAGYNAAGLAAQPNFANDTDADTARALPQVALNYRWPFMRSDSTTGTQVVEPIAQVILAPNAGNSRNRDIPNEDSLDSEFSDTNLFAFNRFSGIDRLEGGERINYALHGAWYGGGTGLDAIVGQSYRVQKDSDFLPQSGLREHVSDVVARATFTPASWLDLTARTRLDRNDLARVRMADGVVSAGAPVLRLTAGYSYESIDPYALYDQAAIPASYFVPRNEITLGASSQFGRYKMSGYVRRDLKNNQFVAAGAQGSYEDECLILSANLTRRYTSIDNDHGDTTVLFQITFKTVGQVGFNAF